MKTEEFYSQKNYGVGEPDCPVCQGLGYIRYDVPADHPHFGKVFDCKCRAYELEQKRLNHAQAFNGLANLESKTFETFQTYVPGLSEAHLASLEQAFDALLAYADQPKGWLLLTGTYGCGKTHLAAAVVHERISRGQPAVFVTVPDLLDYLRSAFGPGANTGYEERFERIRKAPLLVLDDLGAESPTPWATEKLYQIINYRYNARLPTIITTNQLIEHFDPRIRSRLQDSNLTHSLPMKAPDYRVSGIKTGEANFNSFSHHNDKTLENFSFVRRDIPADMRGNLRRAVEVAAEYMSDPHKFPRWLIYLGAHGCGKTHLAAAIGNKCWENGTDVKFISVPDFLDYLRAAYSPNSNMSYDQRFDRIKMSQLLILDDLGTESATPWAREKLYQLINYRYALKIPTVFTCARPLEELDDRISTRLVDSRLCRAFAIKAPRYIRRLDVQQ